MVAIRKVIAGVIIGSNNSDRKTRALRCQEYFALIPVSPLAVNGLLGV